VNDIRFRVNNVHCIVNIVHSQLPHLEAGMANQPQAAAGAGPRPLWFSPPGIAESPRRTLTRERVVAEALTVISTDGAAALSMRALATRLGVVPGALYRHVRSKEQLLDLVVDGVLAEIDRQPGHALTWTEQVKVLAHRLRAVLEDHPGIAGLLKTRDPLGPHSLALAEAFLEPLQAAGLPERETALAFSLIYDYTLGFALTDRTTTNEQRVQDTATRHQLHAFFRSLPADRFPALAALGEHIWAGNRDQRFTASLNTLLGGIQTARRRNRRQPRR
jgi:TetR/AcrR family transcriptional regulator, tetracycline repressor protein